MVLEEDEGFSDWSHRLENRSEREQVRGDCRAGGRTPTAPRWKSGPEEEKERGDEEEGRGPERSSRSHEASPLPAEKVQGPADLYRQDWSFKDVHVKSTPCSKCWSVGRSSHHFGPD